MIILNLNPRKVHGTIGLSGIHPHKIMPSSHVLPSHLIIHKPPVVGCRLKYDIANALANLDHDGVVVRVVHFDGDGGVAFVGAHEVAAVGWQETEADVLGVEEGCVQRYFLSRRVRQM